MDAKRKACGLQVLFLILHLTRAQDCTFPKELWGNWTTTNLGTVVITGSTPSLTFSKTFLGQTVPSNEMNCMYISGTQYVLRSVSPFVVFSQTNDLFMWMCLDLRKTSPYSYYFYLKSEEEVGFDNYRLVGLLSNTSKISEVCNTTPNISEFHPMVKIGYEADAVSAVQCAEPILGQFLYTYTDSMGTYCQNSNGSYITSCDEWNKTHISVNNSDCPAVSPFWSSDGLVGCIANAKNSNSGVYYISLYNLDSSPTTQFICMAVVAADNGTVFVSLKKTDCDATQTPTDLPTGGATMVLTPEYTCRTPTKTQNYIWIYVLFPLLGLLFLAAICGVCLHRWLRRREQTRARQKAALEKGQHPMGEMSLELDAPPSMDKDHGLIHSKKDLLKRDRAKKKNFQDELFSEQSLNLNLDTAAWLQMQNGRSVHDSLSPSDVNTTIPNLAGGKKGSQSVPGRWRAKTKQFLTAKLVARGFQAPSTLKKREPKCFEMSTLSSSLKRSRSSIRNGLHPILQGVENTGPKEGPGSVKSFQSRVTSRVPANTAARAGPRVASRIGSRVASRAGSRVGSGVESRLGTRRGSIDSIAISRTKKPIRSNSSVVLTSSRGTARKPDIDIMPEEYQAEGDVNEIIPSKPYNKTNLRESYQSDKRRSLTMTNIKRPSASMKPWH